MSQNLRWLIDLDSRLRVDIATERKILAAWSFDHARRTLPFTLDLSPLDPQSLVFRAGGRPRSGDLSGAPIALDDELMLGELKLSEVDQGNLKIASTEAYRRVISVSQASGYPYVLRVWNYFSGINLGDGDHERYKLFCSGRARGVGQAWEHGEPAATVIGRPSPSRWLHVIWLASKTPGQAIDNPRQTTPRDYPRSYGPDAPRFARGTLWRCSKRGSVLFASGTAAVIGASSQHAGDLIAQLDETVRNLKTLLQEAAVRAARPSKFDAGSLFMAYVRDETRQVEVREWLRQQFPNSPIMVIHGDICRSELLVEVEAIHHFDPPR